MISLKAFAPVLASILGTTPAAVYERQRALVRAKVLPTPAGRGRGNGLPATAENVALMLMAIMATDNLSETDGRVKKLADAKVITSTPGSGCAFTGARTFKTAVVEILKSEKLLGAVVSINVSREDLLAQIYYYPEGPHSLYFPSVSSFGRMGSRPMLEVDAKVQGDIVRAIGKAPANYSNRT
jgi:hypothetical protein